MTEAKIMLARHRQASASDRAAYSETMEKLERAEAEAKKHASEAAAAKASVERVEYKVQEKEKLLFDERAIHKEIATELEAKLKAAKEELRKTLKNVESDRVNVTCFSLLGFRIWVLAIEHVRSGGPRFSLVVHDLHARPITCRALFNPHIHFFSFSCFPR